MTQKSQRETLPDLFEPVVSMWRRQFPGRDLTAFAIGARIARLSLAWNTQLEQQLQPYGIGLGEMDVLFCLLSAAPRFQLRPSDISRSCFVTSGATTGRVDRLIRAGLVSRVVSTEDRREIFVSLTAAGKQLAKRLQLLVADPAPFSSIVAELSPQDQTRLEATLSFLCARTEQVLADVASSALLQTQPRRRHKQPSAQSDTPDLSRPRAATRRTG